MAFIYLIRTGDFYKIGKTMNLDRRLSDLQCANPIEIELIHYWSTTDSNQAEKAFHRMLEHLRVRGEWFKLSNDDIQKLCVLWTPENKKENSDSIRANTNIREIEIDAYEFTCEQCGHIWMKMNAHLPDRCPSELCRSRLWNRGDIPSIPGRPRRKPRDPTPEA